MLYTENLGLRDCVGFSQIRSHILPEPFYFKTILLKDLSKKQSINIIRYTVGKQGSQQYVAVHITRHIIDIASTLPFLK